MLVFTWWDVNFYTKICLVNKAFKSKHFIFLYFWLQFITMLMKSCFNLITGDRSNSLLVTVDHEECETISRIDIGSLITKKCLHPIMGRYVEAFQRNSPLTICELEVMADPNAVGNNLFCPLRTGNIPSSLTPSVLRTRQSHPLIILRNFKNEPLI